MVTKVYVGNLPKDDPIREDELRGVFSKFGDIVNTWIARKPAGFAFIEFADERDAQDAVNDINGRDGWKVEISMGNRNRGPPGGGYGGPPMGGGGRGGGFRVKLEGLPPSIDWRDLKDFLRTGGDVTFANANPDGTGIADFSSERDMRDAISKLDGTDFQGNKFGISEDPNQPPPRMDRGPPFRGPPPRDFDRGYGPPRRFDDRYGPPRDRYDDRYGPPRGYDRDYRRSPPRDYDRRSPPRDYGRRSPPRDYGRRSPPRDYGRRSPPRGSPPRFDEREREREPRDDGPPPGDFDDRR